MENKVLIEYILGGLSEQERERLEEEYFVNDETWQKLRVVEDDLIDSYVRGALAPERRERFENYFLASATRRRRVEFARALIDPAVREAAAEEAASERKVKGSLWLGWRLEVRSAVLAAALVLAILAVFPFIQNLRLRSELRQVHAHEIELENRIQSLEQQLATAKQTKTNHPSGTDAAELFSPQVPTVSLMLTPGLVRNGKNGQQVHVLPLPAASSEVLLLLSLESDDYPRYDVLLRTVEGREIHRLEGLTSRTLGAGDKFVAIRLPAQLFSPGDYIATLSGKTAKGKPQTVDSYSFSVTR